MDIKENKKMIILSIFTALSMGAILIGGYPTTWGMKIDLIAVFWIITYFIFGIKDAFIVAILSTLTITIFSQSGPIGGITKFLATIPMILVPFIFEKFILKEREKFKNIKYIIFSLLIAIIIRNIIMIPFNYYVALPIWIPNMSIQELIKIYPWTFIAFPNIIQSILEMILAWYLVYISNFSNIIKNYIT